MKAVYRLGRLGFAEPGSLAHLVSVVWISSLNVTLVWPSSSALLEAYHVRVCPEP